MKEVKDQNIKGYKPLVTPVEIQEEIVPSERSVSTVLESRKAIENVLDGKDDRKIMIVGPCSVHDYEVAMDYAARLKGLADKVQDKFVVVMRTYFEKPRSTLGWKGYMNDPDLDGSNDLEKGLILSRQLVSEITGMGLPCGTEFLNTRTPQYLDDLISWGAIGARTTESQPHREMASGLSMPIGFKNNTYGEIAVAVDGVEAALHNHTFHGIDKSGRISEVRTRGNPYSHLILRGGNGKPNYGEEIVKETQEKLAARGLPQNIIIDCSHDNTNKDHTLQPIVFEEAVRQMAAGNKNLVGVMIESNISEGQQKLADPSDLKYGVSITDACVSFEMTNKMIMGAYRAL